jgi:hypothetical protein
MPPAAGLLMIAKLDAWRNVAFIANLMQSGVEFIVNQRRRHLFRRSVEAEFSW